MAQPIRLFRRRLLRQIRDRHAWRVVRRSHVRIVLKALDDLYRKG